MQSKKVLYIGTLWDLTVVYTVFEVFLLLNKDDVSVLFWLRFLGLIQIPIRRDA